MKSGDIVNIDVTVIRDGFHGDTSRMYYVGAAAVIARRLTEALSRGHVVRYPTRSGLALHLGDIGHAIQTYAESNGFSVVREYCGHGIGRIYHEDPRFCTTANPVPALS